MPLASWPQGIIAACEALIGDGAEASTARAALTHLDLDAPLIKVGPRRARAHASTHAE